MKLSSEVATFRSEVAQAIAPFRLFTTCQYLYTSVPTPVDQSALNPYQKVYLTKGDYALVCQVRFGAHVYKGMSQQGCVLGRNSMEECLREVMAQFCPKSS